MEETIDTNAIIFEEKIPSGTEHHYLRSQAGGLTPPPTPENEAALLKSWYCITIRDPNKDNKAVGMGRIVGDGINLFVVDMALLPAYQRKGLGGKILEKLLNYVDLHAPKARLALEADPPGVGLYKKHGFLPVTSCLYMVRRRN